MPLRLGRIVQDISLLMLMAPPDQRLGAEHGSDRSLERLAAVGPLASSQALPW
jgi:hypothetical protein